jgi:hypothetical protein
VTLLAGEKVSASAEIHGGSGYLSQSAPTIYFMRPSENTSLRVQVRWPGGKTTMQRIGSTDTSIVIQSAGATIERTPVRKR